MARPTVLIVDDNPINARLASVTLTVSGFDVRTASNADAAVRVLDEWSPSLILMDLQMPGTDGFELTRQLKATERFCDTPVVALTSYAMPGDEAKARAAGCDGYIAKPIDTKRFADQVSRFLRRAESRP